MKAYCVIYTQHKSICFYMLRTLYSGKRNLLCTCKWTKNNRKTTSNKQPNFLFYFLAYLYQIVKSTKRTEHFSRFRSIIQTVCCPAHLSRSIVVNFSHKIHQHIVSDGNLHEFERLQQLDQRNRPAPICISVLTPTIKARKIAVTFHCPSHAISIQVIKSLRKS